jgi:hypothetical protein
MHVTRHPPIPASPTLMAAAIRLTRLGVRTTGLRASTGRPPSSTRAPWRSAARCAPPRRAHRTAPRHRPRTRPRSRLCHQQRALLSRPLRAPPQRRHSGGHALSLWHRSSDAWLRRSMRPPWARHHPSARAMCTPCAMHAAAPGRLECVGQGCLPLLMCRTKCSLEHPPVSCPVSAEMGGAGVSAL